MSARVNVRALALKLLMSYEREGRFVNLLLNTPEARALEGADRAFLCSLLYTTVENKLKYDYFISVFAKRPISEIDSDLRDILRLGMCQLFDMSAIPDFAVLNETVSLAKVRSHRSFANAILRRACESKDAPPYPDKDKSYQRYLSVRYSLPLPLVRHYAGILPKAELEPLFCAFSSVAPLSLTVNTKRADRDELLSELSYLDAKPSKYSKRGIIVYKSANPAEINAFKDGKVFVQDEASRIAVEALSLKRGECVIDVCSAPGGKSFFAAGEVLDTGRVYSFELHESKLSLINDGASRLGLDCVVAAQRDARCPDESLFGKADALIVDAPCSGLGVIGKKPDLRYKELSVLTELPELQYEILKSSAKYLKPGGRLVYSTCTLNPEENERIAERFIEENPEYCLEDFSVGELTSSGGVITLYPHIHSTDGFFVAKIRKKI